MAISVNWATKVISVPQSYLSHLGGVIYELDLDALRLDLKALEAGEAGMSFLDTHSHNTTVTLGGVTLARVVEFINGYTVTFEDGQYAVEAKGANSNIADVMNLNQVSLRTFNSAGLIVHIQGSGVTEQDKLDIADRVWDELLTGASHNLPTSAGRRLRQLGDVVAGSVNDGSPTTEVFITTISSSYDDFYNDQYIRFIDGNLAGIVRVIKDYDNGTQEITVSEALPVAPEDGDEFDILPVHIHTIEQIAKEIWETPTGQAEASGSVGERLKDIADDVLAILSDVTFIKNVEGGKWEISGNDMIFYMADNVTEVMRFTIARDGDGNPIMRTRQ